MSIRNRQIAITLLIASGFADAQSTLNFKTRRIDTSGAQPVHELVNARLGPEHLIIQFDHRPSPEDVTQLKARGVNVLNDVPQNGLVVAVASRVPVSGLGIRYAAPIDPRDKISPVASRSGFVLVEFHPDVDINTARGLILSAGIELEENPDLGPHHLMIRDNAVAVAQLARLDEVAYIFPASDALAHRILTKFCEALTTDGAAAQSIPTYGAWGGAEMSAVTLTYVFSQMTEQLAPSSAQTEIERAMAQWSKAVQVTWQQGTNPTGNQTVNILFATYAHGDGFPFDGPGGVLAHTFYPDPPNPEPIAGDMHFNDSETWKIGANTDLFSVALHELGHALGLGHSDDPAAVMYPYYQMVTELSPLDISTVQTLYAATPAGNTGSSGSPGSGSTSGSNGGSGASNPLAPNPAPSPDNLALTVNPPASTTASAAISLTGSTSGGKGTIVINWSTNQNASGSVPGSGAWTIPGIPLSAGSNTITITASDTSTHVSQVITVTRQPAATTGNAPTGNTPANNTPPSLTITSPASTSVSTTASSISFAGTASDNLGVTAVTWATNTGQSGTANGTTSWTAPIPLLVGANSVTIRAADAAGNTAWRSVVVTRQ